MSLYREIIKTSGNNKNGCNYEVDMKIMSDRIHTRINLIKSGNIAECVAETRTPITITAFGDILPDGPWVISSEYIPKEDRINLLTYQDIIDYIDNLIDNDIIDTKKRKR